METSSSRDDRFEPIKSHDIVGAISRKLPARLQRKLRANMLFTLLFVSALKTCKAPRWPRPTRHRVCMPQYRRSRLILLRSRVRYAQLALFLQPAK